MSLGSLYLKENKEKLLKITFLLLPLQFLVLEPREEEA
jgi:hypothetical protein